MGQLRDTYVEARVGGDLRARHGVTLESTGSFWLQGETPEELREDLPSVSLAAVHGAVAFYLDHQAEVDALLAEHEADYEARRALSCRQAPARER